MLFNKFQISILSFLDVKPAPKLDRDATAHFPSSNIIFE